MDSYLGRFTYKARDIHAGFESEWFIIYQKVLSDPATTCRESHSHHLQEG